MKVVPVKIFAVNLVLFMILGMAGCKSYRDKAGEKPDTGKRGTIHISADESFKPVIDEQVNVYESNNPNTNIEVHYKPEADCLKDLFIDSIRMVIATRTFNEYERSVIVDSLRISPHYLTVARDAIAVIVHPSSPDTMWTMDELRALLKGELNRNLIPVFDGVKATSTVRFIIDSVLRGDSLTPKAMAASSSEGVIDFVSSNTGVVGFIGVSWIGNPEDEQQLSFLKKVRVVSLESTYDPETFVKAYQENIHNSSYPMVRDLVYILKEKHKGLGYAFAGFLSGEIGQLIFRRSYLVPVVLKNFGVRPIELSEE
jgi:phosphate transport system substrate-binding protein